MIHVFLPGFLEIGKVEVIKLVHGIRHEKRLLFRPVL